MTYGRITEPTQLPPDGPFSVRAREKHDIDFKRFADDAQPWEHAKDIAAFANALGGVIVVGADAETEAVLAYPGLRSNRPQT